MYAVDARWIRAVFEALEKATAYDEKACKTVRDAAALVLRESCYVSQIDDGDARILRADHSARDHFPDAVALLATERSFQ
jgi:hypothetical protein